MKFKGFQSIRDYEMACRGCGMATERRPFCKERRSFFVLVTAPVPGTSTSIASWHLFSVDEREHIMEGVINGWDENYLGKLAAQGYFPNLSGN